MKQKKFRRFLSVALVLTMLLSVLPVMTLAADTSESTSGQPFSKGTLGSSSYRIPAMVTLNNGTIVAAADARWNTTYDGGCLDTAVAYSTDNGATWTNYLANYLDDNGNVYNGSDSTAFIDPCLATDGSTVYMLCDLYPYGVALNGSGKTAPSTSVGFNSDGKLLLSADDHSSYGYYLDGTVIKDSSGNAVSGLTVDEYFNVTGTYGGEDYDTNLFFSDSPFKVVRTGYLYLTKSTDRGKSWSAPTLIPGIKTDEEQVCLVGPGRGLVTSSGKIVFPVYSYCNGDQLTSFLYSTDNGSTWKRSDDMPTNTSANISWSSESAVVELSDGTLRFFFRNGSSKLCYADYTWGSGWSTPVNTGVATNSNTQLSAISYSKTVDGEQVILVSCPTGPNAAGSSNSDGSYRTSGKIFAGIVDSEYKTMTWTKAVDVTPVASDKLSSDSAIYTADEGFFAYSCLTELADGSVAILYEDRQNGWGAGSEKYFTMDYATYESSELGLTFDTTTAGNVLKDEDSGVSVNFGDNAVTAMTVTKKDNISALDGMTYVAYDISVEGFEGTATVTIPLKGKFADNANLRAVYIKDSGEIGEWIEGTYDTEEDTFTFTATHFSTYAVTNSTEVTLTVGGSASYDVSTSEITSSPDSTIATAEIAANPANTYKNVSEITSGKWYLLAVNTNQVLTTMSTSNTWSINGFQTENQTVTDETISADLSSYLWQITETTGGYTIKNADGQYLAIDEDNGDVKSWGTNYPLKLQGEAYTFAIDLTTGAVGNSTLGAYLNNYGDANTCVAGYKANSGTSYSKITFYEAQSEYSMTITAVSVGTTSVEVGGTTYNITVERAQKTVNVAVDGTATYTDASTSAPVVADSTVASATLSDDTLTIKGLKDGTTTITTDTTVYTVTVSEGTAISIEQNTTTPISVTLENDQTVEWSSADSSYVGVAGKYDTTAGAYGNEAILAGQNVTSSPVVVTATIKDADGNVVGTQKWLVTVTPESTTGDAITVTLKFDIIRLQNCTLYYCINGGALVEIKKEDLTEATDADDNTYYYLDAVIDNTYTNYGHGVNISFFAAPDEGYALTYMAYQATSATEQHQYFTISDGNPDGTGSEAWPFDSNTQSTIPESSGHTDWKNQEDYYGIIDGVSQTSNNCFGYGWALFEGDMTIDQWKVMMSTAIALGCDGAQLFTKKDNGTTFEADLSFVAQKLPTIEKEIASITRNGETLDEGSAVKIGDTINYTITVTRYATNADYGTITYADEALTDKLTNNNGISGAPDMGESTTSDQTYTYTTTLTLTKDNFGSVVKGSTITNTAELSYSYSSKYSSGSLTSKASAVADVTVDIPVYVIDFGLPVEIVLSDKTSGDGKITEVTNGTYGTCEVNTGGNGFIYTPNKVLQGEDLVTFTYQLTGDSTEYKYNVKIVPASNVLYEEGFMSNPGGSYADWTGGGSKDNGTGKTQTAGTSSSDENVYGYDDAYATLPAGQSGTQYVATVTSGSTRTDYLSFTFKGTGFDLIGACGSATGTLLVRVVDADGKYVMGYLVDTSFNDSTVADKIYQVPLVHAQDWPEDTYTVTVRGAYINYSANGTSGTSLASLGLEDDFGSVNTIAVDPVSAIYDLFDSMGFTDEEIDSVEFINMDKLYGAATLDGEDEDSPQTTIPAKMTLEIDGFRVYYPTDNSAYCDGEKDVEYVNVLDAVQNGFAGYIERDATGENYTRSDYESSGGPQREIYLPAGKSVTFQTNLTSGTVQISARAVTGTAYLNDADHSITSNTEMYYKVTVDSSGVITISNADSATGMLAIGNLKVPAGTTFSLPTETTYRIAFAMLRSYAAAPVEPEEPEVSAFTPERLDIKVKSVDTLRGQRVTVTITASTDVAKLTVNGQELKPINSWMVKLGWSDTYTYVFTETVKKGESISYEIVAYNADGLASAVYTAEPEEPEAFTPEQLDVKVARTSERRNDKVTLTITASTDVAKLTVNGKTLRPTNSQQVKRGRSDTYTYVLTETVRSGETRSYEVIAYDADGVASEPTSVTG